MSNEEQNGFFAKPVLYAAFSAITLDVEGSNIACTGWIPSESDKKYMDDDSFSKAVKECEEKNAKVLFKNVSLNWDSCDCGDGYGCSHGSYVFEINIFSNGKNITIEYTDGDSLEFYNEGKYCKIPTADATIFDFVRMCEICKIELELSDYAVSLLK